MARLAGKVVFITGASAGIGEACARQFADNNSNLILTARRTDKLEELKKSILEKNSAVKIHVAQLDVSSHEQVNEVITNLPEEFKNIDILVNNAGLALGVNQTHENQIEAINTVLDVNVKGVLYMIRAIVPSMIARNSGQIINISSIAGIEAYRGGSVYCASKHAVQAITNTLRKELVATNIRVNSICPGMVETEFSVVRFAGDKSKADSVYQGITPLVADDIAESVIYVASRPPHINIAELLILPNSQASVEVVHRQAQ